MSKQTNKKTGASVLGAGFVVSLAASPLAGAVDNPFELAQFEHGYSVAAEGACGAHDKQAEGACGAAKGAEGACGGKSPEGKCGAEKGAEGACGSKSAEGKCGG
jgi:uncharacterized low-complexity protein